MLGVQIPGSEACYYGHILFVCAKYMFHSCYSCPGSPTSASRWGTSEINVMLMNKAAHIKMFDHQDFVDQPSTVVFLYQTSRSEPHPLVGAG